MTDKDAIRCDSRILSAELESAARVCVYTDALLMGVTNADECPYDSLMPETHTLCPLEFDYVRKMTDPTRKVEPRPWTLFGRAASASPEVQEQFLRCLHTDGYFRNQTTQYYAKGSALRDAFLDKVPSCNIVHGNETVNLAVQYAALGLKLQRRDDVAGVVGIMHRHVLIMVLLCEYLQVVDAFSDILSQHYDSMSQRDPEASCDKCVKHFALLGTAALSMLIHDPRKVYALREASPMRLLFVALDEAFRLNGLPCLGFVGKRRGPGHTAYLFR